MSPTCPDTIYLAQLKMSQAFDHQRVLKLQGTCFTSLSTQSFPSKCVQRNCNSFKIIFQITLAYFYLTQRHHLRVSKHTAKLYAGTFVIILSSQLRGVTNGCVCWEGCYLVLLFQLSVRQKHTVPHSLYCKNSFPFAEIDSNSTVNAHRARVMEGLLPKQSARPLYIFAGSLTKSHSGRSCQNLFMLIIQRTLLNGIMSSQKMNSCSR